MREHPALLDGVRARVERWLDDRSVARPYAEAWREILSRSLDEIEASIVDPSPRARDLRQCSPFAGVLDPRTRWRILRELRRAPGDVNEDGSAKEFGEFVDFEHRVP
ncbi:MAG: hypothetical protein AAGF11_45555 [Myxococcota bacterium]